MTSETVSPYKSIISSASKWQKACARTEFMERLITGILCRFFNHSVTTFRTYMQLKNDLRMPLVYGNTRPFYDYLFSRFGSTQEDNVSLLGEVRLITLHFLSARNPENSSQSFSRNFVGRFLFRWQFRIS